MMYRVSTLLADQSIEVRLSQDIYQSLVSGSQVRAIERLYTTDT
jgi:hypothetical protein